MDIGISKYRKAGSSFLQSQQHPLNVTIIFINAHSKQSHLQRNRLRSFQNVAREDENEACRTDKNHQCKFKSISTQFKRNVVGKHHEGKR